MQISNCSLVVISKLLSSGQYSVEFSCPAFSVIKQQLN